MPDIYDQEIEYLLANPGEIFKHWGSSSPLFSYLTESRTVSFVGNKSCGCPTMIKGFEDVAQADQLTELVCNCPLIPDDECDIIADRPMLEAFADIQREADRVLGRTPPTTFK